MVLINKVSDPACTTSLGKLFNALRSVQRKNICGSLGWQVLQRIIAYDRDWL